MTKCFLSNERFGLITDMLRSANSITHNIAVHQLANSFALSYITEKTKTNIIVSGKKIIKEISTGSIGNALIKTLSLGDSPRRNLSLSLSLRLLLIEAGVIWLNSNNVSNIKNTLNELHH